MATKKRKALPAEAIAVLKKDHEKVRGLLSQLERAASRNTAKAEQLLAQVDREVKIHSQIEEEIFYPAFKEAARTKNDKELFFEAVPGRMLMAVEVGASPAFWPWSPTATTKWPSCATTCPSRRRSCWH